MFHLLIPPKMMHPILRTTKPLLMYFLYNGGGYAINCDWLQYSVMLYTQEPELRAPKSHRVEICQGNNVFKHRALVYDHSGRKVLTLLWSPYSSTLPPLVMTVQVANESLYTGNILSSLPLVKEIVDCVYNSIGRFDICCDFQMTDRRLQMVKHLNSGHYYVERKGEGSAFWHEVELNDHKHKQTHCISWGSKTSEIKVKLYNKSRELGLLGKGDPEKPWIIKEWDAIGIDKLSAWRLEFSLKSNGQLRWHDNPILLDQIASPSWQMRVFFDLYFSRFVTRINQGRKNGHHNSDERVFLIDLPKDGEKLKWAASTNNAMESQPAIQLLRSLMRNFENEALIGDKMLTKTYTDTVLHIVWGHHLEEYFERTFGEPAPQFLEKIQSNSGAGVKHHNVSIAKLID